MAVVDSELFVSLGIKSPIANATSTFLSVVHFPVLLLGDAQRPLPVLVDPAGFACGVFPACLTIFHVELGRGLSGVAYRTKCVWKCLPSSLCTFSRTAMAWLRIARVGVP